MAICLGMPKKPGKYEYCGTGITLFFPKSKNALWKTCPKNWGYICRFNLNGIQQYIIKKQKGPLDQAPPLKKMVGCI